MDLEHRPKWIDVECPNCGEGCGGDHANVQVCVFDEEDWPCAIAAAEARGYQRAIEALRAEAFRVLQESPSETAAYEHARNFLAAAQTAIRSGESDGA